LKFVTAGTIDKVGYNEPGRLRTVSRCDMLPKSIGVVFNQQIDLWDRQGSVAIQHR
jgi:hypothetical protein